MTTGFVERRSELLDAPIIFLHKKRLMVDAERKLSLVWQEGYSRLPSACNSILQCAHFPVALETVHVGNL
jgi:hypothetical protein